MTSPVGPPQRAIRIIPAVPRKFERRAADSSNLRSNANQATSTAQDFGIEKHGKLPPPFYPSEGEPVDPVEAGTDPEAASTNVGEEKELIGERRDSFVAQTPTDDTLTNPSTHEPYDPPESEPLHAPAYPVNLTPPADDPSEVIRSQYPLQAHPFVPFQHQPTPPTDVTPSPTHYAYQHYPHADHVAFYPPQDPNNVETSPTQSAYQGYTYAPNQRPSQPSSQIHDPPDLLAPMQSLSFDAEAPRGSRVSQVDLFASSSQTGFDGQSTLPTISLIETRPDPTIVEDIHDPLTGPESTSSIANGSSRGRYSDLDFISNEIQHPEDAQSLDENTNVEVTPTTTHQPREVWHQTILSDLQHASHNPPFPPLHVSDFLLQRFDSSEYADCCLRVIYRDNQYEPEELYLHRVLIAQSPALVALLTLSEFQDPGIRSIQLEVPSTFVNPTSLRLALRTCYGQSAWDFVGIDASQASTMSQAELSISWMRNALAFTAAGTMLQLEEVVSRGTQVASTIMSWDNLETAITFAMEGVVDSIPRSATDGIGTQAENAGSNGPPGTSDVLGDSFPDSHRSMTVLKPYTNGVAAYRLKQLCLRFLSAKLTDDWKLNTSADPLESIDRLPIHVKGQSVLKNTRLSNIRFGSLPLQIPEDLDSANMRMSSIILSVPYNFLHELLELIEPPLSTKTIASIVSERERRRTKALQDTSVSYHQRIAMPDAWGSVGWHESVNVIDIGGTQQTTISRDWTGLHSPAAEGS